MAFLYEITPNKNILIMRKIDYLVVHCSATKPRIRVTVDDIDRWHKERGFRKIGYHYVIYPDGTIHNGRDITEAGAHVAGNNSNSIGICYIGGLDINGKISDTRTAAQKSSMLALLQQLKEKFPNALICGHRDFSPDRNGNGIIEEWEWTKECPCFDASSEYGNI